MAVSRAGVGYKASYIAGGAAAGSISTDFNVNPAAANKFGVVIVGWVGDVDTTSMTFTPTWNGATMTALSGALRFDSNKSMLRGWIIANPAAGATTVAAAYASAPFGLLTRNMFIAAVAVADVESDLATIIASTVTAVGSGVVASGGVTVPSGVAADRVYSAHLVGKLRAISTFTGTRVAAPLLAGGGQLVLGESRGAPSTVATATFTATTAQWAALGFNTDALPLDDLGFSGAAFVDPGSFGADLYRLAEPHPDRDYLVPPINSADPFVVAGPTVRNANGVDMPVWTKDPDDTLDYTLRWNNHLAPDDEIIAVDHSTTGSLRLISEAFTGAMTQMWLKGGTVGVTHPVRIRFWTKRGRQHDFTAYVAGDNN